MLISHNLLRSFTISNVIWWAAYIIQHDGCIIQEVTSRIKGIQFIMILLNNIPNNKLQLIYHTILINMLLDLTNYAVYTLSWVLKGIS